MRFVWDARKAVANRRKHGVGFDEAATVFDDLNALVQRDVVHVDRLVILGMSSEARLVFVVYVEFEGHDVVRIISAPKATPHERKAYQSG